MKTRTTILGLMTFVLLVAIGFAALREATGWWASGAFSVTLLVFALAAAYAVHRRGPRRAFWSAFAAFGWSYMLFAFCPGCETSIRPRLLTKLLDALAPIVHPATDAEHLYAVVVSPQGGTEEGMAAMTGNPAAVRQHFQDIGHSMIALLLAAIGGIASRSFYAHRDERRREAAEKAAGVLLKVLEAGL
jgi:MFS family permease